MLEEVEAIKDKISHTDIDKVLEKFKGRIEKEDREGKIINNISQGARNAPLTKFGIGMKKGLTFPKNGKSRGIETDLRHLHWKRTKRQ